MTMNDGKYAIYSNAVENLWRKRTRYFYINLEYSVNLRGLTILDHCFLYMIRPINIQIHPHTRSRMEMKHVEKFPTN